MRLPARLAIVALAASGVAACSKVEAKLPPPAAPPPPLVVPAPPDRLIVPTELPAMEVVEPPAPAASATANTPNRSNRAAEKPAAPPPAAPPPIADPPPPVQTPNVERLEAHAKQELLRANEYIERIHYATLSPGGRAQYDEVIRYIREAERAIGMKNYVFADELAKKAATLASLLVKGGFQ